MTERPPSKKKSKITEEAPLCKTLCLCFEGSGDPPNVYAVRTVPVQNLLYACQKPALKDVWLYRDDDAPLHMGCGKIGSQIYLVGGQNREKEKEYIELFLYSRLYLNYSVLVVESAAFDSASYSSSPSFEFPSSSPPSSSPQSSYSSLNYAPRMISGKHSPLVVELDGSLYVLSELPLPDHDDMVFESYTPETRSWQKLESPPFLDQEYKYSQDPAYNGYAVIGRKICVSTLRASFVYDVDARAWGPCDLFDSAPDPDGLHQPWEDEVFPVAYEWMDVYRYRKETIPCGRPFGFFKQAVLYGDDILICIVPAICMVVAHQLVGGKVVRTHRMEDLEIPGNAIDCCLANLGLGFFCLTLTVITYETLESMEAVSVVSLIPFSVKRLVAAEGDSADLPMLEHKILNHFSYENTINDPWSIKVGFPLVPLHCKLPNSSPFMFP